LQLVPLVVPFLHFDPQPLPVVHDDYPPSWALAQVLSSLIELGDVGDVDFASAFDVAETGAWWSSLPEFAAVRQLKSSASLLVVNPESLLYLLVFGVLESCDQGDASALWRQVVVHAAMRERGWTPEAPGTFLSIMVCSCCASEHGMRCKTSHTMSLRKRLAMCHHHC